MSLTIIALAAKPAATTSIWAIKSGWSAIADGATFLLAVATLSVAYLTRKLSKATVNVAQETNHLAQATVKMVRQEDEHHRDRFVPMCVLVPRPPPGGVTQRGGLVSLKSEGQGHESGKTHHTLACIVHCDVHNVGVGPALSVLMKLRLTGLENCEGVREMSFIGAGQAQGENRSPAIIVVDIPQGTSMPKGNELSNTVANEWEIDLEYNDVFGKRFVTRHMSNPEARWATFKKVGEDGMGAEFSGQ